MKSAADKRFCGNCGNHTVYHFPDKIFCGRRLEADMNPVMDTLGRCGDWNPADQECFCIKEVMKNKESKIVKSSKPRH